MAGMFLGMFDSLEQLVRVEGIMDKERLNRIVPAPIPPLFQSIL